MGMGEATARVVAAAGAHADAAVTPDTHPIAGGGRAGEPSAVLG